MSRVSEFADDMTRAPTFELAGPRHKVFFEPEKLRCGIVTCGGLCPGLNNVVRGLVLELNHGYGVRNIVGFRYGYEGLVPRYGHQAGRRSRRNPSRRSTTKAGPCSATSRGDQSPVEMADRLWWSSASACCSWSAETARAAAR